MFPLSSIINPLESTLPITLPLVSRTNPSSSMSPITFPSGPIALRTLWLIFLVGAEAEVSSQIVQSSLVTADPVTGTFADLTFACPKLSSYHETIKLF